MFSFEEGQTSHCRRRPTFPRKGYHYFGETIPSTRHIVIAKFMVSQVRGILCVVVRRSIILYYFGS